MGCDADQENLSDSLEIRTQREISRSDYEVVEALISGLIKL
jgi:hypothetical protein